MKNILVLSPIYPADDIPKTMTPVVHYFAREWVKMGYNVQVMNYISNFPKFMYCLFRPLNKRLSSLTGSTVRKCQVNEKTYEIDGVNVRRIPLNKILPHSRFSKNEISRAYQKTVDYCESISFSPDCIIGHWFNPQLELLGMLKHKFGVPAVLVLHNGAQTLTGVYKDDSLKLLNDLDILGFRSDAIKRNFEQQFKLDKPSFYCYSGIPEQYMRGDYAKRTFKKVESFVFVGTLYERKHPLEIIYALEDSYKKDAYSLSYVGLGTEGDKIQKLTEKLHKEDSIKLLGRVERSEVQKILHEKDVFIMISKNEAFGLVYLEAMAAGCITNASRNEGFDGIIKDGVNGFLCEAGNVQELSSIITKIRNMDSASLCSISDAAIATALELTDKKAAARYIKDIENILG